MHRFRFCAKTKRKAWRLVASLERALMPRRCVFCGACQAANKGFICTGCRQDLPSPGSSCVTCGMPVDAAGPLPCAACQQHRSPFFRFVAALEYDFPADAAIRACKFHRQLFYVPAFTWLLLEAANKLPVDIDAVLPVPLHRWRKLRRGFNQAMELARPVAAARGLPILKNVHRVRATPFQSGLDAKARQQNMKDAFRVRGRILSRHVLLVDDVVTTGTTCKQLAKLLHANGVARVSVLALARVMAPPA